MSDKEWFCVETSDGRTMGGELTPPGHYPNYESALDRATELAPSFEGHVTVVRFQRSELTKVSRDISVKLEDVSSKRAKA